MSFNSPSSEHSDLISILTAKTKLSSPDIPARYVCHTATIPLCTNLDMNHWANKILPDDERTSILVRIFHGENPNQSVWPTPKCSKRCCMYTSRAKNWVPKKKRDLVNSEDGSFSSSSEIGRSKFIRQTERIFHNCPCLGKSFTFEGEVFDLQPICWLSYIKSLNLNLVGRRHDSDLRYVDAKEIMFCHNSTGMFDNHYPKFLRDDLGVTGFGHVKTIEKLHTLLCWTYWYRKYGRKYGIATDLYAAAERAPLWKIKAGVTQVCHTINGLLMKKFFAWGPELGTYRDIADQTACLFKALFNDYLRAPESGPYGFVHPEGLVYSELKDHLNEVKQYFHKPDYEDRISWLDITKFKSKALKTWFASEYVRLSRYIGHRTYSCNEDYTLSPAFVYRATMQSQTRVLGYLPASLAIYKRQQFRETVNREYEVLTKEREEFIRASIRSRLNKTFPPSEMAHTLEFDEVETEEKLSNLTESIGNVNLFLKGSASTHHTVSSGGKIEEARQLIQIARENSWEIPIRDLASNEETGEVLKFFPDMEPMEIPRVLFWISYQLVINWAIETGLWKRKRDKCILRKDGEIYHFDPMEASIVHISEPGKERNLTKCTGVYAWFLTPASKITQKVLSRVPEHTAGLEASAHEWIHQKRISIESKESGFIYDPNSRVTYDDIQHAFKDWRESTDFISKRVGWSALSELMDFIAFPKAYKSLVQLIILLPQPVTEVVEYSLEDDDEDGNPTYSRTYIQWSGAIREGFMMGNPMTKTVLHLMHIPELEFTKLYLERVWKLTITDRSLPHSIQNTRVRIDREAILRENDFEVKPTPATNLLSIGTNRRPYRNGSIV